MAPRLRRLRVVQVVRSLRTGGQEVMLTRLALGLDRDRFDCSVLVLQGDSPGGPPDHLVETLRDAGIDVTSLGAPEAGVAPALVVAIARFVRRTRPDIVHTHNVQPLIYAGAASIGAPRVRLVATAHGPRCWSGFRFAPVVRALAARSPFVAVSDDLRQQLAAMGWSGRPMLVIVNGVDTDALRPTRDRFATRRAFGFADDAILVGTVGRLAEEKGHATLLAAMRLLRASVPRVELVVAGDGPLRATLEATAKQHGLAGHVHLLGDCRDVPALLGALDVFCLPSDTEGTSVSLLEAMACEVPVVATGVGGTPSALDHGAAGWLVPPREPEQLAHAIASAITEGDETCRRVREARRIVERRFSLRTMIARYAELYTRVALPS